MSALGAAAKGFHRFVYTAHLAAGMVVLPLMVALIGLDVTMRYVVADPLIWAQELTSLLLIVLIMLGLGYGYARGVHVRMEMIYERGSRRFRAIGDILAAACGLLLFGMVGWQALRDIPYMLQIGEATEELGIVLWPFRVFLCAMCALVAIQLLLDMTRAMLTLTGRGDRP